MPTLKQQFNTRTRQLFLRGRYLYQGTTPDKARAEFEKICEELAALGVPYPLPEKEGEGAIPFYEALRQRWIELAAQENDFGTDMGKQVAWLENQGVLPLLEQLATQDYLPPLYVAQNHKDHIDVVIIIVQYTVTYLCMHYANMKRFEEALRWFDIGNRIARPWKNTHTLSTLAAISFMDTTLYYQVRCLIQCCGEEREVLERVSDRLTEERETLTLPEQWRKNVTRFLYDTEHSSAIYSPSPEENELYQSYNYLDALSVYPILKEEFRIALLPYAERQSVWLARKEHTKQPDSLTYSKLSDNDQHITLRLAHLEVLLTATKALLFRQANGVFPTASELGVDLSSNPFTEEPLDYEATESEITITCPLPNDFPSMHDGKRPTPVFRYPDRDYDPILKFGRYQHIKSFSKFLADPEEEE